MIFISAAVFVNIGVWLLEQLVRIDFELLSVSYIISEIFLLLLCLLLQSSQEREQRAAEATKEALVPETAAENTAATAVPDAPAARSIEEQCAFFAAQRAFLTPTEHIIYDAYLDGKSTKEIMAELNIKENTLKYHNKNIYSKLGVSSRKQLVMIASLLKNPPKS